MEGTHQDAAGFGDNPVALVGGEGGDARAGSDDGGGADEDGVHRCGKAGNGQVYFAAGGLAAEGVATRVDIDEAEGGLVTRGAVSQAGGLTSQDGPGAGAVHAHAVGHGILDGLGEAPAVGEFADGGGFTAGEDEPVQAGEVFGLADLFGAGPEAVQDGEVFGHGPLEGEDADGGLGGGRHDGGLLGCWGWAVRKER